MRKKIVKSVGPAGLERIELQQLTERIGKLYAVLHEAAAAESIPLVGAFNPPVDVCETAEAIWIRIELPGVSATNIRVAVNNDKLRVSGEKKKRHPRQRIVSHLCSERAYGRFNRCVPLRWTISRKHAIAELKDGMLIVHLPKIQDRRGSEHLVPIKDHLNA